MATKRNPRRVTFRTETLKNHAFGYKYNVKKYVNGYYAGVGKFCRTK